MSTGKQIAKNVIWKYLEMISVSGIQLICTFVMARFLTPDDYGILGIVLVFSAFADVFIYSGFGQALIREKEVTRTDYSTILYFNLGVSLVMYVFLYFSSGLIAYIYKQPILDEICKVVYLVLPIHA
ncbi:MAG: oligosaccharide flippase family protein, partial [Bacteroidaceae bacterium]|nr:oligosaccharide flippase family protein [Bacteroidaceae bacterium]